VLKAFNEIMANQGIVIQGPKRHAFEPVVNDVLNMLKESDE
jgi:hypothetical protein